MNKNLVGLARVFTVVIVLTLVLAGIACAAPPGDSGVNMESPAANAAVVATMPGFQDARYQSFFSELTLNEGLIIRQSYVKNGKIIIPKYGLYYTVRNAPAEMLKGEKIMLLGKMYTIVDTETRFDVVKDVFAKAKQLVPIGDGSKALELSALTSFANGYEGIRATFKILKPTGNYYGNDFPVSTDPKMRDITTGVLRSGTGKKAGSYQIGEGNWTTEFWDRSANTSGMSYLLVDSTTAEGVKIKEFGTPSVYANYLSAKDPVELVLGPGESGQLGDYVAKVTSVTGESAAVELVGKDGTVTRKTLGPLNAETAKYLPGDHLARGKMLVRPPANDVQVSLDVFRKPFRDGKVALLGYTDLIKLANGDRWAGDSRFTVRPDT